MQKKYRVIGVLLVLIMSVLLGACGGEKTGDGLFYVEKEITLPEGSAQIRDICRSEDGKLFVAVTEKDTAIGNVWESSDQGKSWNKKYSYTKKLGIKEPKKTDCLISLSVTGEAVCMVNDEIEDLNKPLELHGFYIDTAGNSEEIKYDLPKSKVKRSKYMGDGFFSGAVADEKHLIVTNVTDEVYLIDKKTGEVTDKVLENDNIMTNYQAFAMENHLLHIAGDEEPVIYDMAEKKVVEGNTEALNQLRKVLLEKASDVESVEPTPVMAVKNNCYYLVHRDGITKFDDEKTEHIVSQRDMTPDLMETYSEQLLVDENENFYLAANSRDGDPMLLYYEKQEGVRPKPEKTLEIYALKEDAGVQKLADAYEKVNKKVEVHVTFGMKTDEDGNIDDTMKKLNTKMMGGDGPDVLFLDGLDTENYIDNDMLLQLDEQITALEKENILQQVVNTYKKDGKTYAVPVRFGLPVTVSKYEDVVHAKNSKALIDKLEEHNCKISEYAFPEFARYYYQVFFDDNNSKGMVSQDRIKSYLTEMKKLKNMEESGEKIPLSHLMLPPTDYTLNMEQHETVQVGVALHRNDLAYFKSLDGVSYDIASNGENRYYVPRYTVGVSAFSENKEEGKELIQYLLSEKGQKIYGEGMGFSVDQAVLREMLGKGEDVYIANENDITVKMPKLRKNDIDQFMRKVEQVNTPTNSNSIVMRILLEYTEDYLNDKVSSEEATDSIVERLEMYENES